MSKNLRAINFRVKKSLSASGSDKDFLTTKFFELRNFVYTRLTRACQMEELRRESCIRGHHVYKSLWNPVLGEVLLCEKKPHNATDRYSVAVTKRGVVVGHLPRKICRLFTVLEPRGYNRLYHNWSKKTLHRPTSRWPGSTLFPSTKG